MEPLYRKTWISGELRAKTRAAEAYLSSCCLCPRNCRVNRLKGEEGFCRQGPRVKVARSLPHFGEEPPLSGSRGAGTVFFSGCALRCLYCQNYQISQEGMGRELEVEELARLFLELQNQGCHNLDLVSPTPHLPFIFFALEIAVPRGLRLPIVYNTHGYLSDSTLSLLKGIVDIYLPDMKYADNQIASRLSEAEDYPDYNQAAVRWMFDQVGPLKIDAGGLGYRGVLTRHLVLPGNRTDSFKVVETLATISPLIPLSLMAQYRPRHKAARVAEINRPLKSEEYQQVVAHAERLGLEEIFVQELESADSYFPDFTLTHPFPDSLL